MIKLNLGCGHFPFDGWVNIDLFTNEADIKADAKILPFKNNCVDIILASHLIEHFHFLESLTVLKEWYRVLKPNSKLIIECPDLKKVARAFIDNTIPMQSFYICIYGEPWIPGSAHYYGWYPEQLIWALKGTGFRKFEEKPATRYINVAPWALRLEAIK